MNYHQAPPKTTGAGTIVLYLALIFFGLPILLCCGGGVVLFAIGASTQGNAGGERVTLENLRYQGCIALHKRHEQELLAEMKALDAQCFPKEPPAHEQLRVNRLAQQHLTELRAAVEKARPLRGIPPPPDVMRTLNENPELEAYVETMTMQRATAQRAEQEQRLATARAEQSQREQQREAQRLADQQAREQRQQQYANNNPPRFNPPAPFNPPPPNPPSPPVQPASQQPAADQPPPGFPATDLAQVKPRDIVMVQSGENKWVEALVQAKRGKLVQVRAFNGEVAVVTIERLRVQTEPVAKAEGNLPAGLRVVEGPNSTRQKNEEEDDALFTAKPGEQAATTETPEVAPTHPAATGKKPAGSEYRIWTDDTGGFKVEAEVVHFEFDLVQLRRSSDGKILTLRIEKLSAEDQKIVREKFP